jgi:hypothetical protein
LSFKSRIPDSSRISMSTASRELGSTGVGSTMKAA